MLCFDTFLQNSDISPSFFDLTEVALVTPVHCVKHVMLVFHHNFDVWESTARSLAQGSGCLAGMLGYEPGKIGGTAEVQASSNVLYWQVTFN